MNSNDQQSIILASASPRRRLILQQHGFRVNAIPSNNVEELLPGEEAQAYVSRLAKEKAQAVLTRINPDSADWLLAADTTVAIGEHILEKPYDYDDAHRMLRLLSGKTHAVHTAYALVYLPTRQWHTACVTTEITFHNLSEQQIHEYINTGDPFDKAGGYGIQTVSDSFVKKINGSYYNVMGLPIEDILVTLARVEYNAKNRSLY